MINSVEQNDVGQDHGESLEDNDGRRVVIEALVEVYDGGVHYRSELGEKALEVGEERGVIEGPWAGLVGVPVGEGE